MTFKHISKLVAAASVALCIVGATAPSFAEETNEAERFIEADYYVIERMLVKKGNEAWFEDYWTRMVLPVFKQLPGFLGAVISTTEPDPTLQPEDYDFSPLVPLGPPAKAFLPHGGIHLNGVVTNTQINFESVMRGTYNYTVIHYWKDAKSLRNLVPGFEGAWKAVHGQDTNPWGTLEKDYFSKLENHWDLAMRVVR